MKPRTVRMKLMYGSSKIGERLHLDWLTYNPLIFWYYHEAAAASAPAVADTLEAVFPEARTFIDVGAGSGAYAAELQRRSHPVVALEHSRIGRLFARRQGVPIRPFDLDKHDPGSRELGRFDLAYCFEVAEHLPPHLGDRLVEFIAATSDTVVFTAARPGQGGAGHINEQPPHYWISRFAHTGMRHRADLQDLVTAGFAGVRAHWLATNALVFTRKPDPVLARREASMANPVRPAPHARAGRL